MPDRIAAHAIFFHIHIFQDVQNIDQTFLDVLQDVESDDEGF